MGAAGVHRAAALAAAGVILMASGRHMLGGWVRVSGGVFVAFVLVFAVLRPERPLHVEVAVGAMIVFITSRRCVKCRDLCETKGSTECVQPNHTTVFDVKGYMHFARVLL